VAATLGREEMLVTLLLGIIVVIASLNHDAVLDGC
jgi:hypothetical protein